jgi:hypothetical protein
MKNFGTKDMMRMEDMASKSGGNYNDPLSSQDFMTTAMYAHQMAQLITDPGKAMARGYAAQEFFGELPPIAYIFFERADKLSDGNPVRPNESENWTIKDEDDIEEVYMDIPIEQQPITRRQEVIIPDKFPPRKRSTSSLIYLGKLNTIKGTGPQFNLYDYPVGTIEVWEGPTGKPRIIYVNNYEPNYKIGEPRNMNIDGVKNEEWKMIDWIESEYISNLAPLYGKSIPIYNYD